MMKYFKISSIAVFILSHFINLNAQIAFASSWNVTTSARNVVAAGAGSNRLLLYVITFEDDDNTNDVTAVTYGGQAMTQAVQSTTITGGTGSQSRAEIWYLGNAGISAATNNSFIPVFSISDPSTSHGYYTMAVTLSGVNQTTPICSVGIGERLTTSTINLSSGISVLPSELFIYATHGGDSRTHTPATGYTEHADLNGAGGGQSSTVNSKSITTAGTENPRSTASGSQNRFVMSAVRIIPNGATCSSALPIELTQFDVVLENDKIKIDWETTSEQNNDFFTIERSLDGVNWEDIMDVKGAGNSTVRTHYTKYDLSPIFNQAYYRLKQTDYDRSYQYSWIREINLTKTNNKELIIYPNPSKKQLTILGVEGAVIIKTVYGIDVTRQIMITKLNQSTLQIDISDLPSGTYFLNTKYATKKFIKL